MSPNSQQISKEKPQVPAKASQPAEAQVVEKDEEGQTQKPPPRRKMLAKGSNTQQSIAPAHYPFISTRAKKLFIEIIWGKQSTKERAMNLDNFGTNREVQEIIQCLG